MALLTSSFTGVLFLLLFTCVAFLVYDNRAASVAPRDAQAKSLHEILENPWESSEELKDHLQQDTFETVLNSGDGRRKRFPSVEERVKLYMSNWYVPPCRENKVGFVQYRHLPDNRMLVREVQHTVQVGGRRIFEIDSNHQSRTAFYLDKTLISECEHEYCLDTQKFIFPALDRTAGNDTDVPVLLQFGDTEYTRLMVRQTQSMVSGPNVPVIKKFRRSIESSTIDQLTSSKCVEEARDMDRSLVSRQQTFQPIIWKLKTARHLGVVDKVFDEDIPWSRKKNGAVFRGGLTGLLRGNITQKQIDQGIDPKDLCMAARRCRLVYKYANSTLVDAKLTPSVFKAERRATETIDRNFKEIVPDEIDGITLFDEKVRRSYLLGYKAIIMLEGNDVSSGLKWALYSNSVVLMQKPEMTSWAMEERLIPWYHYVPLNEDLSNVEEMTQWVLDNEEEAQTIAHHGMLWMHDLLYHPDAEADDDAIFDEMMRRYKLHFEYNENVGAGL